MGVQLFSPKALGQVLAQSGLFGGPSREDESLKDTWLRKLLDCPEGVPLPPPRTPGAGLPTLTGLYWLGCKLQIPGMEIRSLSSLNLTRSVVKPESTHPGPVALLHGKTMRPSLTHVFTAPLLCLQEFARTIKRTHIGRGGEAFLVTTGV